MLFRSGLVFLLIISCVSCKKNQVLKTHDKHTPHVLNRAEVIMHELANQGVPLVLHWVFVEGEKAQEAVGALTAHQFMQAKEYLSREYPKAIRVKKYTAMPGETDILGFQPVNLKSRIYLFAHFLDKSQANRWVVLPRARVRITIHGQTLDLNTRRP